MSRAFVHLRVHSEYSLADGIGRVKALPARARELGMPALAITDLMNFYGAVKFYRACSSQGVKPIIGLDVLVKSTDGSGALDRLTLLCRNNEGFRFLNHVLTRAYVSPRQGHQVCVEADWFAQKSSEHLIALCAGADGELGRYLLNDQTQEATEVLDRYRDYFGERFLLDVHHIGREREDEYTARVLDLGERHGVPAVATNQVQFLTPNDFEAHDIRVCINEGRVLNDPRRVQRFSSEQYLRNAEEMAELFPQQPALLENTLEVARQCNVFMDFSTSHMPAFPTESGWDAESQLKQEARQGLDKRLAVLRETGKLQIEEQEYNDRLERELDVIIGMGFAGYFLIVADFIRWAKENDIPVGPGRGSGAGSLVAWVIEITDLDPLEYGLLFERFLNPERVSLPDFDIDFCMDRRDEVIEYVSQRYGRDRVSQIITYGTMAARAVVRDVGRVMGHAYGFMDSLAKMVPFEVGITLDKALEAEPALKQRYEEEEEIQQLIDAARLLEGLPRNVGKHAGGVVIAPDNIAEFVSLYKEPGMAQPVTQFDKDDLESIGLVKFDFLGLRTLTVIHNAVKMINRAEGGELDINRIALDDAKTYELIKSGRTTGVFQLESRGMKEIIMRLLPDQFEDLIALVALFRPGPLQSGMVDDFINRKHGRERIEYPHPDLEEILHPTYGVILYQEQVMQIAQVLSGYTLGAADLLRRAMGKKKPEEMAKQRAAFVEGADARSVDSDTSGYIFDLVEKFAGYGFNKSHSAAYALLTYQTAWLKTHYPAEFMASSLTADMEHTDKVVTLIAETRALGLEVHPPSVNHCQTSFKPVSGEAVYYGLGALKGVGEKAIDGIVLERESNGAYRDLFDFCERIDSKSVNKRLLEALIHGGALDCFDETRASHMANLQSAVDLAEKQARDLASGQNDLFGIAPPETGVKELKRLPEWPEAKRLGAEKGVLGLFLTGHPFEPLRAEMNTLSDDEIVSLKPVTERELLVAGLVTGTRIIKTKRGDNFAILTLDDNSARIEVSVSPKLLLARRHLIHQDAVLVARGTTSLDDYTGNVQMRASDVFDLPTVRSQWLERIVIRVKQNEAGSTALDWLRAQLRDGGAATRISVEFERENGDQGRVNIGGRWRLEVDDEMKEQLEARFGAHNLEYLYDRSGLLLAEFESAAA